VTTAFRTAVEAQDHGGMVGELAEDVVFNSPVAFKPFVGRDAVSTLFRALLQTFEDFQYTDEFEAGDVHALVFRARVGDKELEGVDLLRCDDAGKIRDFTVFIRPASGLMALAQAMAPHVEGLK
jgi:hypothetical protein